MSTPLTPEQRKRIEENRRLALEKRAAKIATQNQSCPVSNFYPSPNKLQRPLFQPAKEKSFVKKPVSPVKTPWTVNKQPTTSAPRSDKGTSENGPRNWNVLTDSITGTCSLISKSRFTVDVAYNSRVIDILKSIPGRQYDANKKAWNFPLEEYETLKAKITPLSPHVCIGNIPNNVLKIINNKSTAIGDFKTVDISGIEPTLLNSLFPFQKEGVQYAIAKNGKCLIADEMGLGKTLQALAIADYYLDDWPLLIVCPSSMRFQWQEEILRYLPKIPSYTIHVITTGKTYIENVKIVIVSYDLMCKLKDTLMNYGFGIIIFDESHSLKNFKTQRTKASLDLVKKAKRCILLSGTPALSRPIELFPQIKAIQPHLFTNLQEYGIRYCEGKQDKFGWNFQGSSFLEELKVILEEKLMIRRLKCDVLDQLPSKMRQVIVLNSEHVDVKSKKMSMLLKKLNSFDSKSRGGERRSTLLSYYAESGRAKEKAICNHIEELLEQNKKFLCFAHHKTVLDAICQLLEQKQIYYIRIDGNVNSEERKDVCDQFQDEDKFRVAVLSLTAANTGVTLTAAQLVVFAEIFWNPGELIQAEDRAHRIGQKNSVLVQYLIANGTADDYLWPLVQSKLNVLNQAGLSKETNLSVENIIKKTNNVKKQPTILQFFSEMEDDIDDADLTDLMDEIEGVPQKKLKI